MSDINTYFRLIIAVSIAASLIMSLFGSSRFKDGLRFLSGVLVLSIIFQIISPLFVEIDKLITLFPDEVAYEPNGEPDITEETVIKESARQMAQYLKKIIIGKFGIPENEISVSVSLSSVDETIEIKNVTVSVIKKNMGMAYDISEYISSIMGCSCIVIEL